MTIKTGDKLYGMYATDRGTTLDYSGEVVKVEDGSWPDRKSVTLRFSNGQEHTYHTRNDGTSDYTDHVVTCPHCGQLTSSFALRIHHQHDA